MNRSILFLLPALGLVACQPERSVEAPATAGVAAPDRASASAGTVVTVGAAPAPDAEAMTAADAARDADEIAGETVTVAGTVSAVCRMKGCWLTLQTGGEPIRVVVPRDASGAYVYTFPMDAAGHTAVLEGTLAVEETPVETLRHLAEDAGKTAAEVAAITAPKREVVLTATGARITRA